MGATKVEVEDNQQEVKNKQSVAIQVFTLNYNTKQLFYYYVSTCTLFVHDSLQCRCFHIGPRKLP